VVKGVRFSGLRDAGDPATRAALYADAGADEIVILDVVATPRGLGAQLETIRRVRSVLSIPLTVGGGVRSADDAEQLLSAGADKVSVNTAAVENPELLTEMASRFGSQCVVLAIDAAACGPGAWEVVVRSGKERTGRDALAWAAEGIRRGAGEILLTSFDRDGTGDGYDLECLAAVRDRVSVPIIASGGAARPEHLLDALRAGADAVLAASIFHDDEFGISEVKAFLDQRGVEVRP
jgi:imidazoleglycerol phosphate synthase cyclase subunit